MTAKIVRRLAQPKRDMHDPGLSRVFMRQPEKRRHALNMR
jgi:hypothetical protein